MPLDVPQFAASCRLNGRGSGKRLYVTNGNELCQAALFETNPVKLLERIAHVRNAVLDRMEDGHRKPLNAEQHDLRDALTTLDSLRRITKRQNGYQSKAS